MKITVEKLWELKSSFDAIIFVADEYPDGFELNKEFIARHQDKYRWLFWLLPQLMTHKQRVQFAVYATEQVLLIWMVKCPDDKYPLKAITAAKKWLENTTATAAAADTSYAAAYAASAAAADKNVVLKILYYGLKLIKEAKDENNGAGE